MWEQRESNDRASESIALTPNARSTAKTLISLHRSRLRGVLVLQEPVRPSAEHRDP
jgi:hypothetical protein